MTSSMQLPLALALACALVFVPACGDGKDGDAGGSATTGGTSGGTAGGTAGGTGGGTASPADAGLVGLDAELTAKVEAAMAKGRAFLLTQQEENGGFTDRATKDMQANVAFTAMAVAGLVATTPKTAVGSDDAIRKGLAFLVKHQIENGAIVDNPKYTNYSTSASISALAAAKFGDFRSNQSKAMAYLEASQIADEKAEGYYGGFPYKDEQTADGSNAFLAVNALEAGGLAKDSVVRKRAGEFASRLQNRSESNPTKITVTTGTGEERTVVSGDDGGAIYRVGESKVGMRKRSDGLYELVSYGSMTYAVLRLMMFAGVPADDPRVVALLGWISENWTVDRNPGFENTDDPETLGQQGMFYYFHTIARALNAYEQATGEPLVVRDADGRKHNWRAAVAQAILDRQADDGSWSNPVDRWMEGMQTLATSFAVQTLGVLSGRLE